MATPDMPASPAKADHVLDAPGVVRNLFLVGAAGFLAWFSVFAGLWSGVIGVFHVAGIVFGFFLSFTLTGLYMVWASKFGKDPRPRQAA